MVHIPPNQLRREALPQPEPLAVAAAAAEGGGVPHDAAGHHANGTGAASRLAQASISTLLTTEQSSVAVDRLLELIYRMDADVEIRIQVKGWAIEERDIRISLE